MHLSEYAFPSVALHCTPSSLFEMKIITIIVPNNNKPIILNSGRTEGRQVMIWVCVSVRTKIQVIFSFQHTCNTSLWRQRLQGYISKMLSTKYSKTKNLQEEVRAALTHHQKAVKRGGGKTLLFLI